MGKPGRHKYHKITSAFSATLVAFASSQFLAFAEGSGNTSSAPIRTAQNEPQLRPPINGSTNNSATGGANSGAAEPKNKLQNITEKAIQSEGALFLDQNSIAVGAPLLTALIELHENQSPYGLDATGEKQISLRDVLIDELANNLDIKISHSNMRKSSWMFTSSLGNFLPSMTHMFNYQTIAGNYASPFGLLTSINTPNMTIPSTINWTLFSGGANLFGAIQANHNYKASKFDLQRTTNDFLLEGAHLYYQLVLQDVLLQIRIKAMETSEALVEKNKIQYKYGANTQLDLYQAETQLARDKQALIAQQVARRKAAVALATNLNYDQGVDLLVAEHVITPRKLVDDKTRVADLVQIAIDKRPELKKWEQERLAAKAAIKVALAPLLPQVIGSAGLASTGAKVTSNNNASAASSAGSGAFGAGSFSTSTVAAQSNTNNGRTFNLAEIYLIGIGVQWNIGGMGLTDSAKVQAAKWQARKAQQEFARELTWVCRSVRDAYLDSEDAENLIAATSAAVNSSREQLKVAVVRLHEAVGTDLDVVNAQRDYTNSLIDKANAIVQYNEAQIKLLRALGVISVDTVTAGKPLLQK